MGRCRVAKAAGLFDDTVVFRSFTQLLSLFPIENPVTESAHDDASYNARGRKEIIVYERDDSAGDELADDGGGDGCDWFRGRNRRTLKRPGTIRPCSADRRRGFADGVTDPAAKEKNKIKKKTRVRVYIYKKKKRSGDILFFTFFFFFILSDPVLFSV